MGRQINFFMMPDDIRELDGQIKKMGLKIIECEMPSQEIVYLDSLLEGKLSKKLIVHPDYLQFLEVKFINNINKYVVDYFNAPLIEFKRPNFNFTDKIIKNGRIYYSTNDSPDKDELFYKIAEKLFRWIRRNFKNTKINSLLTTQRTYDWKNNETGKLITPYGLEL